MKSYNQMADDVLRRVGEYETNQKRKRARIARTATTLCCASLVVLLGIGVQHQGLVTLPEETLEDALYPGIKDYFDESKGEVPPGETVLPAVTPTAPSVTAEVPTVPAEEDDLIIIHQIDGVSSDRMNICLFVDDFIPMDHAALNDYFGVNVAPAVPADLKEWEDQQYGIYKRDGGTGEVYWDGNVLNFSNEDFSRSVNLEVMKGALPLSCYAFFDSIEEKSVINGVEVAIGLSSNGYYHVEFMYKDVGFRLIAEGITEEELINVISSLLA